MRRADDPVVLQDLIQADENLREQMERERRHGPVDDYAVEAELVDPKIRARYAALEPFDA